MALLIFGDSVRNADMYYLTRLLAPDPFTYIRGDDGSELLIISQMEVERARQEAKVKNVRASSEFGKKAEDVIAAALKELGVRGVEVPKYFPLWLAEELRQRGFAVTPKFDHVEAREVKSRREISLIRQAQRACEAAMQRVLSEIENARVRNGVLVSGRRTLTSERLRTLVAHTLLDNGCFAHDIIISCGKDSANPHFAGAGALKADEPIVLDFAPQLLKERYFSDMTRTVVKVEGGVPLKVKEMFEAVLEAQRGALERIRAGVPCKEVHDAVCDFFEELGYGTLRKNAKTGFIHSTGHGVGIALHEPPTLGDNEYVLKKGNVVTVEPGLYEPEVGGVRLEDVVVVRQDGCENLTKFEKRLEL
ncbi:MAG: aminopeptidase P family protein [Candidatus Alkanophagales archaeon]|nr:MAG: aminopeptidase P family protein [Candidatus Alkanophagales archaeon]